MNAETADRFKYQFMVFLRKSPGDAGIIHVTISATQVVMGRRDRGGPRHAELLVATQPEILVLHFQPPEYQAGMTEQDYSEKAIEAVRAFLSDRPPEAAS